MKLNKLVFIALATFTIGSLASCGGDKPYTGDDNIVITSSPTVCQIKDASNGFLVSASGRWVDHNPKDLKLTFSDSSVTYKPAGETAGFATKWVVTPTKVGDFTVTASMGNLKSNEIVLSVIDNVPTFDVKFSITSDMSITYQTSNERTINVTKVSDTYMRSNLDKNAPYRYAKKIATDSYKTYGTTIDTSTGGRSWVARKDPRPYSEALNYISNLLAPSGLYDDTYLSKEAKNITVAEKNYDSVCYTFKATDLINTFLTKVYVVTTNDFCLILKQESNSNGEAFQDDFTITDIKVGTTVHPYPGPTE